MVFSKTDRRHYTRSVEEYMEEILAVLRNSWSQITASRELRDWTGTRISESRGIPVQEICLVSSYPSALLSKSDGTSTPSCSQFISCFVYSVFLKWAKFMISRTVRQIENFPAWRICPNAHRAFEHFSFSTPFYQYGK